MKKRILILACALALLVGCIAMTSMAADNTKTGYCKACKTDVTWEPIVYGAATANKHYYFPESSNSCSQIIATAGVTICIDLNGQQLTFPGGRAFLAYQATAAAPAGINIQDSVGGATVTSHSYVAGEGGYSKVSNNGSGGVMWTDNYCTINVDGGTYTLENKTATARTGNGGVAYVCGSGILNVSNATFNGDYVTNYGGCIDVINGGKVTLNNTTVTGGSVPAGKYAPCVYLRGANCRVTLSGNTVVEDIYNAALSSAVVTVSSNFSGTANLSYAASVNLTQGTEVGTCEGSSWTGKVTCSSEKLPNTVPVNGKLVLSRYPANTTAAVAGVAYSTLQEAIEKAAPGALVELVATTSESVTVNKDTYLQLNGFSITGTVTVNEGKTLYGMDATTDDYTVADGSYGKLSKVVGKVAGMPLTQGISQHNYLAVTEGSAVSFHCVSLEIHTMSLRTSAKDGTPGLYYKTHFKADEKAAPQIKCFGVAVSVQGTPTEQNMGKTSQFSKFYTFESGPYGNLGNATSTLLKGILKPTNTNEKNETNLNTSIFGRAYVVTMDGQYVFGKTVNRSMLQQLEGVNGQVDDLSNAQIKNIANIYKTYQSVLSNKGLDKIQAAWENDEEGTLKVLLLGNSHGLDATNLLAEVFYQERMAGNHDKDVLIGALYYSGCQVKQHKNYLSGNQKVYTYHKNTATSAGETWKVVDATCLEALQDEQWDIILMQQMNTQAGMESQYIAADWKYVADYLLNNQELKPELGFHMTWANPDSYELFLNDDAPYNIKYIATYADPASWRNNHEKNFPSTSGNGKYDMNVMYDKIMQLTQKYLVDSTDWLGKDYFNEKYIMSSATPIQYAQKVLGRDQLNMYRDYTHVSDYGRLMVAYQWYAQLMDLEELSEVNVDVIPKVLKHKNSKYPTATDANGDYIVDAQMKSDLIASVNWALKNPFSLPTE